MVPDWLPARGPHGSAPCGTGLSLAVPRGGSVFGLETEREAADDAFAQLVRRENIPGIGAPAELHIELDRPFVGEAEECIELLGQEDL